MQNAWWLVFLGGGAGSICRFLLSSRIQQLFTASTFPYGTIAVNSLGCLLIGILVAVGGKNGLAQNYRLLLITGFLGGFTTFSSYAYESFFLIRQGEPDKALLNIAGSVLLGLLAVFIGFYSMRFILDLKAS